MHRRFSDAWILIKKELGLQKWTFNARLCAQGTELHTGVLIILQKRALHEPTEHDDM